ncbi:MAG: DEAD/DEAH box helicase family protein, partial [Acidithiobacillus sp.]|uniref:restriction endonuclease n=1 Tax=Acidithiobacillus sp. TaxID=1872118 RepID=UPI003CFC166F
MPNSFRAWLDQIEHFAHDAHHKGVLFERFIAAYLQTDPLYADQLEAVWRYPDWPDRPEHWKADNLGFDLIAKTHSGEYWAIQCKFYDRDSRIDKEAITNFTSDSERRFAVEGIEQRFSYRLLVTTQDALGKQAEEATTDLPDFGVLYLRDLELAPIDWTQFSWGSPGTLVRKPGKALRAHQREAIQSVLHGFERYDRGQLIMACGTGKTFTSLKLMEQMVSNDGLVLFLAPSITLVSQTLREWVEQAESPMHAFVVCSDNQVGQAEDDPDLRV